MHFPLLEKQTNKEQKLGIKEIGTTVFSIVYTKIKDWVFIKNGKIGGNDVHM